VVVVVVGAAVVELLDELDVDELLDVDEELDVELDVDDGAVVDVVVDVVVGFVVDVDVLEVELLDVDVVDELVDELVELDEDVLVEDELLVELVVGGGGLLELVDVEVDEDVVLLDEVDELVLVVVLVVEVLVVVGVKTALKPPIWTSVFFAASAASDVEAKRSSWVTGSISMPPIGATNAEAMRASVGVCVPTPPIGVPSGFMPMRQTSPASMLA